MDKLYINIRNRRKELGMTQQELSEKMGYTNRSSIARIENGDIDLSQSKIIQFAKVLETTPGELMGNVEPLEIDYETQDIASHIKRLNARDKAYVSELVKRLGGQK